jgi:hypothetical protein
LKDGGKKPNDKHGWCIVVNVCFMLYWQVLLQILAMILHGTRSGLLSCFANKNASFVYEIILSVSHKQERLTQIIMNDNNFTLKPTFSQ